MTRMTPVTQVLSLLLVALAMGLEFAHTLELGPKLNYPPELYLRLHTSLYVWFGPPLGAGIWLGAIVAGGVLTWMVRRRRLVRLLTGAAVALRLVALANYFAFVERSTSASARWRPARCRVISPALRPQWEYCHALGFALFTVAFLLLAISLLRPAAQTPARGASARLKERVR